MDARQFLLAARAIKSAGAVDLLRPMPWFLAANVREFAQYIPAAADRTLPRRQPLALQRSATEFHTRASTLTVSLTDQIRQLDGSRIVRLAHQPNLFAYIKLIGQFAALDLLSSQQSQLAPVYYYIDYDTAADERFRRADVPDPMVRYGARRLQLPWSRRDRTALASATGVPGKDWLAVTSQSIRAAAATYSRLRLSDGDIADRVDRLLADVEYAWRQGRTVAEMNAILLSRFVNLWLDFPIPFVSGTAIWQEVALSALEQEVHSLREIGDALSWARGELLAHGVTVSSGGGEPPHTLPWWYVCGCGSRVAARVMQEKRIAGLCLHCGTTIDLELFSDEWRASLTRTVPRILLHNLLNRRGFDYSAEVNHIGSADHVLLHSLAMVRMSRSPLAQLLWQCVGPFGTQLEQQPPHRSACCWREAVRLVNGGNASFAYFALCQSPQLLRQTILAKASGNTPPASVASD